MATTGHHDQPVHGQGWSAASAPDGTIAVFAAACDIVTRLPTTAFHCDCGDLSENSPCEHFFYYFPDARVNDTADGFPEVTAPRAPAQSGDRGAFFGSWWGHVVRIIAFTLVALPLLRACGVL